MSGQKAGLMHPVTSTLRGVEKEQKALAGLYVTFGMVPWR